MALSAQAAGILAGGTFLSSGLSAFASGVSAYRQYKYQKKLQKQAAQLNYDYGIKSLENSPSATRAGLENAGYNPMLAVQNSTSGANAGWTSPGQASAPDYSGAITAGVANAQSFQRLKNETSQTESINDKNYAEADEAKVRKQSLIQRLPFISRREKAEIGNIEKDSMKKEAEIHNLEETTRFIEKDFELRKRLGEMGLNVQRYGIDKNYSGIIYNADTNERNNKRTNRVNTSLEHIRHPYASFAHKSYTSGKDYKGSYRDPWE